jgi:hypothetical protein
MTNQRKGRGTKLTTTFRSWNTKEKLWALAMKSDDPPDKTPCRVNSRIIPTTNYPKNELPNNKMNSHNGFNDVKILLPKIIGRFKINAAKQINQILPLSLFNIIL